MNNFQKNIDASNLTEFLLKQLRLKAGMYLGRPEISLLPNFIIGYQIGFGINNGDVDDYFGDGGFLDWYHSKYNIERTSSWVTNFLEEANGNEREALMVYFKYLEEYSEYKKRRM